MKKIFIPLLALATFFDITQLKAQNFDAAPNHEMACYFKDTRGSIRPLQIDQHHLHVSLELDTVNSAVSGVVTLFFSSLQSNLNFILMDAPGMNIKKVTLDGKSAEFITTAADLGIKLPNLQPGQEHMLEIQYQTAPKKGLYFLGWNGPPRAKRQIWSQGQGIDNRHWIPHVDAQNDKLTTSIEVVFDKRYQVISNGKLIQQTDLDGNLTKWHYAMDKPHSSYLIALTIGNYAVEKQLSASKVPILNYYYPERFSDVGRTYHKTTEIFDWLESETGMPYPWSIYAQAPVKDFLFGGMENTSATLFNDMYHTDSFQFGGLGYFRVNLHELAHQWFGNLMTSYGGTDHWLHEGFATVYEYLGEEVLIDSLTGTIERLDALGKVLESPSQLPIAHADAGSLNHYQKAALVLYQLREQLGPEDFQRATQNFLKQFAYQNATSKDFELALHRTTGHVFEKYFNQWVHQPHLPALAVDFEQTTVGKGKAKQQILKAYIQQTSEAAMPFEMQVELAVGTKDGAVWRIKKHLTKATDTIEISLPAKAKITWYGIDPRRVLLAEVSQKFTPEQAMAFFEANPSYAYRWQILRDLFLNEATNPEVAWVERLLKAQPHPKLQRFLLEMLLVLNTSELSPEQSSVPLPAWAVTYVQNQMNVEIAGALLSSGWTPANEAEKALLLQMLEVPSMEVREGVLLTMLFTEDDRLDTVLKMTEGYVYRPYGTFPVTWHFLNLVLGKTESFPYFLDFITENHDLDRRKHAFELMGMARVVNPFVVEQAYIASQYFNRQLSGTAKDYLQLVHQLAPKQLETFFKEQKNLDDAALQKVYERLGISTKD